MKGIRVFSFALSAALAATVFVNAAIAAPVMLVDRGLPTANLNNAAGGSRSNVQWADNELPGDPFYLPGDDFTITGAGAYRISTIRIWSSDNVGLKLWGGIAGGATTLQSSSFTATSTTYVNLDTYQGSSGAFRPLYQIDFAVNIPVNAGQTYQFFLEGPAQPFGSYLRNSFLHASNAALSGSTQQGSDDTFLWLDPTANDLTWFSGTGGGTTGWGPGWDKDSDANVRVFGNPVVSNKDQCKNNGWMTLVRADGSAFSNQGDCIQYVNTGK